MPIREIYERQEDGSVILVSTEEYDAPDLSLEIQITALLSTFLV